MPYIKNMNHDSRDQRHANHGYTHVLHFEAEHNTLGKLGEDALPFCSAEGCAGSPRTSRPAGSRIA
jgi:hypothetical protein